MFLNHLKNFFLQKIVKRNLSNVHPEPASDKIRTVGILFDESNFSGRALMIVALFRYGIEAKNIRILVFRGKIKKNEKFDYPVFSQKDLSWAATFDKSEMKDFTARPFDLLINFYDTEKPALLTVSNSSKAHFKVGFASVDKKINHFMIDTTVDNYEIFLNELFKYLKILNKI